MTSAIGDRSILTWPFYASANKIAQFFAYFVKLSVFRTIGESFLERWVVSPIAHGILNLWKICHGGTSSSKIDSLRLAASASFLNEFAQVKTLATSPYMLFKAADFDRWIEKNGGVREGEWIRPKTPQDWTTLQRLRAFKWFQEESHAFRVPAKLPNAAGTCILRCQGFGRTLPMDKAFVGLHLAAGFDYCVFDWRKDLSINGSFCDAEAAYQTLLKEGYRPQKIKAMGSCRATFVIAKLKELHHAAGLGCALIHPPPSLRAMVEKQAWPSNKIGMIGLSALEKGGDEHYDTLKRLHTLPKGTARICLIMSEDDTSLPKGSIEELKTAAEKAGPVKLILEPKGAPGLDAHLDDPLRKPEVLQQYLQFLTN